MNIDCARKGKRQSEVLEKYGAAIDEINQSNMRADRAVAEKTYYDRKTRSVRGI